MHDRVAQAAAPKAARRQEAEAEQRVRRVAMRPHEADSQVRRLDREWDVERVLELNAASLSLVGVALAAFVDRRFLLLPAVVGAFLVQHALQGWCPPLPVLRRLGFRTRKEIDSERAATLAVTGRLHVPDGSASERASQALRQASA